LDVKKRFSEEQIIGFLREAEAGMPKLCEKNGERTGPARSGALSDRAGTE
jgi:hypothetical protein